MKRAPELRDLSDHHHRGLVQARGLRRAATGAKPTRLKRPQRPFWSSGKRGPPPTSARKKRCSCR